MKLHLFREQELGGVFGIVGQGVNHGYYFGSQGFDRGFALLAGDEGYHLVLFGDQHVAGGQQKWERSSEGRLLQAGKAVRAASTAAWT